MNSDAGLSGTAPPRRTLDEIVHYETYDMSKYRSDEQMAGFVKTRTLQGAYGRNGRSAGGRIRLTGL